MTSYQKISDVALTPITDTSDMVLAGPDDEFKMPSPIIQHIQSFLTPKEAARTTILSKPWYTAWSTNGVLYLGRKITERGEVQLLPEFQKIATKSINRFKTMNLKLDELRLWMCIRNYDNDDHEATARFYDQLILDALNLGVTLIDIDAQISSSIDIWYTLTPQVFDSVSLKGISLQGCRIGLNTNKMRVVGSRIVSLKLVHVEVEDDMMRDILTGCPLLEDLTLYECRGLKNVDLSVVRRNLKNVSVRGTTEPWFCQSMLAEFGTDDDHQYPNMISLELDKVLVYDLFKNNNYLDAYLSIKYNFGYRFPCLEKFKLIECADPGVVEISSDSITCLSLIRVERVGLARIHVPKLRNFNVSGNPMPSLDFHTPDHKWKSCIEETLIGGWNIPPRLEENLTALSSSEISLVMNVPPMNWWNEKRRYNFPKLENLAINFYLSRPFRPSASQTSQFSLWEEKLYQCRVVLCDVLFDCSPKFLTLSFEGASDTTILQCREVLYNKLKTLAHMKTPLNARHGVNCIRGLMKVNLDIYDQTLQAWQRHPDPDRAWRSACEGDKVRFRMKWNMKRREDRTRRGSID